jgi:hypothetical protein
MVARWSHLEWSVQMDLDEQDREFEVLERVLSVFFEGDCAVWVDDDKIDGILKTDGRVLDSSIPDQADFEVGDDCVKKRCFEHHAIGETEVLSKIN